MVTAMMAESMTIQWDSPVIPNGIITTYLVIWSPDNGTLETFDTTCNISNLTPCTEYTVTVSAATSKGFGPPGGFLDVTNPRGKKFMVAF